MGKASKDQYFFYDGNCDRERRGGGPMTWLHKYEMSATCCWHIMAKNRLQIHIPKETLRAFYPLTQGKVISSSSLFYWRLQVAKMKRKTVYCSLMTTIRTTVGLTVYSPSLTDVMLFTHNTISNPM